MYSTKICYCIASSFLFKGRQRSMFNADRNVYDKKVIKADGEKFHHRG